MSSLLLILVSCLAMALPANQTLTPATTPKQLHVSPDGDDTALGSSVAPLRTLAVAQFRARSLLASGEAVEVVLHTGVYRLDAPLLFTPADSGGPDRPAVWRAAEGATPVVSGSALLRLAWRPSELRPSVYEADTPNDLEIDQLWLDGRPTWMARFPNRTPGPGVNVFDAWVLDHRPTRDPARDALDPTRTRAWANPAGAYLHAMHPALWGGIHFVITGTNPNGTLALSGGTQNNRGTGVHSVFRFVENVLEELDAPGEWFHDRAARRLYLLPFDGTHPRTATVEASRTDSLFIIRGSVSRPVRHLEFRGLAFRHTDRTFLRTAEPLLRSDWTIHRGGALFFSGTEDVTVSDCALEQLGGNAVFVSGYNRRFRLAGSLLRDVGASGVCFVGDVQAVRNPLLHYDQTLGIESIERTPGPRTPDYPADCSVEDTLITRTGRVEKQSAGVHIAMASRITVKDCSIYELPRAGINIGDGCWGGHVVDGCDVFDTVLETGDHGSFNAWGRDRFWVHDPRSLDPEPVWAKYAGLPFADAVEPITLANSRWKCDHGWDIDLDDGSSNYHIVNNLCLRGGIKLREGFGRVVEGNVVLRTGLHPHVWFLRCGDVIRRNIFSIDRYFEARMHPAPWGAEMDYNLVHTPGAPSTRPAEGLAKQSGRDAHSVVADARFTDPDNGDFRTPADSPARALGINGLPPRHYGVRKPSLRAIARVPTLKTASPATAPTAAQSTVWWGASVRDLTTIEEASAVGTGLADGGVLVLVVPPATRAESTGLREGDLIIAADGKPVRTTTDLPTREGRVRFIVFRNQSRLEL